MRKKSNKGDYKIVKRRSDSLATDPEIPGSIPAAARFSEKW
jgi:hypothetical protein